MKRLRLLGLMCFSIFVISCATNSNISIQENNKSYIRSSYEESLNTQALIEAAIKSQNSNKMELAEKI